MPAIALYFAFEEPDILRPFVCLWKNQDGGIHRRWGADKYPVINGIAPVHHLLKRRLKQLFDRGITGDQFLPLHRRFRDIPLGDSIVTRHIDCLQGLFPVASSPKEESAGSQKSAQQDVFQGVVFHHRINGAPYRIGRHGAVLRVIKIAVYY